MIKVQNEDSELLKVALNTIKKKKKNRVLYYNAVRLVMYEGLHFTRTWKTPHDRIVYMLK